MSDIRSSISRFLEPVRSALKRFLWKRARIDVDAPQGADFDEKDETNKFSRAWYRKFYAELGDGISCYRPSDAPDYGGGMLAACLCCKPNTRLHLLPNEEKLFEDVVNDSDFRLTDHPGFLNRKTLVCSKLGLCAGRKPYVCRTAPVYFVNGLMLFEESLCRLTSIYFLNIHKEAVERIRGIVYRYKIDGVFLGYGRTVKTKDGNVYSDYEH